MTDLTMADARKKQGEAETLIREALDKFTKETGLEVTGINAYIVNRTFGPIYEQKYMVTLEVIFK